jgi:hypothetical protein
MRTWDVIALILLAVATLLGASQRAYVLALIAAGIAATIVPMVFDIQ